MRASRGLKWENKMYKLKRSIKLLVHSELLSFHYRRLHIFHSPILLGLSIVSRGIPDSVPKGHGKYYSVN